jgi:hypothetical protein
MSRATVAAGLALAATLLSVQAHAQSIRTFVSTAGSDSNPCSLALPCRHFSAAVAATSPGGEVDALDAGAYGSFTISQAITIDGQGWSYVAPPNNGNAITINAGTGNVTIRGVSLNGVGTSNTNGIVFNSGSGLAVINCVVQNFTGDGVAIQPASGTTTAIISNTYSLSNGGNGIVIHPTGSAGVHFSIDQTTASKNNSSGIDVDASTSNNNANGTITNSHADYNGANGIAGIGHSGFFNIYIHVKNTFAVGNNIGVSALNIGTAVSAFSGAGIVLDNDYIAMNNLDVSTTSSSVFTFGNNAFGSTSGTGPTSTSHR